MNSEIHESDKLRLPDCVCEPDPRTNLFVYVNKNTGEVTPKVIDDQYQAVACFTLNSTVPSNIATHFETAKNLFLYAWFVYRFYPVAEQHVVASLEFALRERLHEFVASEKEKRPKAIEPGLKKLLGHAIKEGIVRNENILARERLAKMLAKERYSFQKSQEARSAGVDSWIEDDSEIVVTQEDKDYDWLGDFYEIIPRIRNSYAHGSWHLYPAPVHHTFEMVSEIINQLFPVEPVE
jgi:hypothetical protein